MVRSCRCRPLRRHAAWATRRVLHDTACTPPTEPGVRAHTLRINGIELRSAAVCFGSRAAFSEKHCSRACCSPHLMYACPPHSDRRRRPLQEGHPAGYGRLSRDGPRRRAKTPGRAQHLECGGTPPLWLAAKPRPSVMSRCAAAAHVYASVFLALCAGQGKAAARRRTPRASPFCAPLRRPQAASSCARRFHFAVLCVASSSAGRFAVREPLHRSVRRFAGFRSNRRIVQAAPFTGRFSGLSGRRPVVRPALVGPVERTPTPSFCSSA